MEITLVQLSKGLNYKEAKWRKLKIVRQGKKMRFLTHTIVKFYKACMYIYTLFKIYLCLNTPV